MSPTTQPTEFFTWTTLATYAGAVLAVWLATNVTRYVTGLDARWVALAWYGAGRGSVDIAENPFFG